MHPTHILRFIRANPFSILSVTSILGDSCYLGYALHAPTGPSAIRLIGALAALFGNLLILAYGDAQAGIIASEPGWVARLFLALRRWAKRLMRKFSARQALDKPIFRGFGLLALNGVSLAADGFLSVSPHRIFETVLGVLIVWGCGCFAAADLVKRQRTANILTKLGPTILSFANVPGLALGLADRNGFLLLATCLFLTGNLAGYFTRIDKSGI